jgi:ubiquinol-cytochrome c reductase cytochrome b/c1 subunit
MLFKYIKNKFPGIINHLIDYPTPSSISYWWGFGSLAGIFLVIQIITGIILAMHYVPNIDYAFLSVEHIMRDVNYGWFIRYLHANGASMFFIIVYIHIGRGLYYGSYLNPREHVWMSGVVIFILMMATAFIGYVLPWGQMSFWGATVITNLFSAIPVIGESVVYWIWGGFSVNNATLNRFFSLHYLLPFILAIFVILHIYILHFVGSNTPLGVDISGDRNKITFYPYFYVKDLLGLLLFFIFYLFFVFFFPNVLGHSDNYIEANPMVTPAHIVPEWYFLPFYAILRSIPDKLGGVICMGAAIFILLLLPIYSNKFYLKSNVFKYFSKKLYWFLVFNVFILGWIGAKPVEMPYIIIGQISTFFYFFIFLVLIPLFNYIDNKLTKKILNK